jgi:hypothetical protein
VQQDGYDLPNFGIFEDRADTLWRKPYLDGAVRELTSGNDKSVEELRSTVEQMILARGDQGVQVPPPTSSPAGAARDWRQFWKAKPFTFKDGWPQWKDAPDLADIITTAYTY